MLRLQHHDHALGVQLLDERVGDLRSQALLHLRALREHVHQARELRQSANAPVGRRDVGHVRHAEKRHQVVLAHGVERDVAHQHHFLVVLVERGGEVLGRVLLQTREHLLVHARHARRRLAQALAVGVLAHPFQNEPHPRLYFRSVHNRLFSSLVECMIARRLAPPRPQRASRTESPRAETRTRAGSATKRVRSAFVSKRRKTRQTAFGRRQAGRTRGAARKDGRYRASSKPTGQWSLP